MDISSYELVSAERRSTSIIACVLAWRLAGRRMLLMRSERHSIYHTISCCRTESASTPALQHNGRGVAPTRARVLLYATLFSQFLSPFFLNSLKLIFNSEKTLEHCNESSIQFVIFFYDHHLFLVMIYSNFILLYSILF